jgi:hypothetical protein
MIAQYGTGVGSLVRIKQFSSNLPVQIAVNQGQTPEAPDHLNCFAFAI